MVCGFGSAGGVGKNIGIGCTDSNLGKAMGVELVLDTAVGSTSGLVLGPSLLILSLNSSLLGHYYFHQ